MGHKCPFTLAVSLCLTLFITTKSKTTALTDFCFSFLGIQEGAEPLLLTA